MHRLGIRLCDHKNDNILYDPAEKLFYLTDLEGIRNADQDCRVLTFNAPCIDWTDSYLFDYIHFLSSFQFLFGVKERVDRESSLVAEQITKHLPVQQTAY